MTERIESDGFFEMLWDCDHCGTKGLLGKSQRHCPECGAPQNPDKRYYPTPEQQQKVEGHTYVGADRRCPSCDAPMGAKANNCTQCGSPLDGSKEVRGVDDAKPTAPPRKKRRIWPYAVAGLVVLGLAVWWLFIRSHEAEVTVVAHRWERAIAIEQFGPQHHEGWRDAVPVGADLAGCTRRQRSSRQIEDGEDCHTERHDRKDGTFEQVKKCKPKYRSEPIDDDWCSYTVRAWGKVDAATSSGTGLAPAWPAVNEPADPPAVSGARRQGARTEHLVLDFGPAGTCEVSDAIWRKYSDGQHAKLEVRARSDEVVCGSL
jgi:hypothetical protein